MLRAPLRWLYRVLGRRYPRLMIALQFQLSHLVVAGGLGLLALYVPDIEAGVFWRIFLVCQVLVAIENVLAIHTAWRLVRPADAWLRGDGSPERAIAAWRALAGLPLRFVRHWRALPVVLNVVPVSVYVTLELGEPLWPSVLAVALGAAVVLLYGIFLRFFALELIMRPVLERVCEDLPDGAELGQATVPLAWRLMVALPAMNIVTGVVAVGFSSPDEGLETLGVGVVVTILVSFTISFELALLVLRSILEPIQDLQRGTLRVARGDFGTRVPVLGSDEVGRLAGDFNQMARRLEERERLHEAFGAFVAPELADRVLAEGTVLEGEEVEVTVLFLDIRGFTAFAEHTSAREVVQRLNDFYDRVVPILHRHGGHANKFVGDGLLGVFGAPDRLADHADAAVAAALEIARMVRESDTLRIGIGVNSGPVLAGTIGGGGRVEFTVIGDPVNTAARVEALTRETGDDVLITSATRALLRADHGPFESRGTVEVKGRREPVELSAPAALGEPRPARSGTVVQIPADR
ncbi:MAG TPA: adenylate/guanylate cyclase domain-containing protein [Baekduia sp.]|nr:adenylate/guanylate cyclase domain-containing protein [Baekduia sp.]